MIEIALKLYPKNKLFSKTTKITNKNLPIKIYIYIYSKICMATVCLKYSRITPKLLKVLPTFKSPTKASFERHFLGFKRM